MVFAVFGGDMRFAHIRNKLISDGFEVTERPEEADVVILPLPVTDEEGRVTGTDTPLFELLQRLKSGARIFGGRANEANVTAAQAGLTVTDYFLREELAVANAVPTAEGAVKLILENTGRTVSGSSVLITGCGRITRVLAPLLYAMGARTTVAARSVSQREWAKTFGATAVDIAQLARYAECDTFINTVPAQVADRRVVAALREDCFVLDLASAPGGIDRCAAERRGIRVLSAPGLPGRVAPKTAGEIILSVVLSILDEEA